MAPGVLALPSCVLMSDGAADPSPPEPSVTASPSTSPAPEPVYVSAGRLVLQVPATSRVVSAVDLPGSTGECVVVDEAAAVTAGSDDDLPRTPAGLAATGCRGGLVSRPLQGPVDPTLPLAGTPAPLVLGSCTVTETTDLRTAGGLSAVRTTFACDEGALQQWVFPGDLVWSLDGGPDVVDLVATAGRVTSTPAGSPG